MNGQRAFRRGKMRQQNRDVISYSFWLIKRIPASSSGILKRKKR